MKNQHLIIGAIVLCLILHAKAGTFHDPGTEPSVVTKGSVISNKLYAPLAPITYLVTNTNPSGSGSFAQAVLNANAHAGNDFIAFQATANQSSGGRTWARITLSNPVVITDAVVIDATPTGSPSQPGNNMTAVFGATTVGTGPDGVSGTGDETVLTGVTAPKVELVGSGTATSNIRINASGVTIRGLAFRDLGDGGGADITIAHTTGLSLTSILIEKNTFGIVPNAAIDPGSGRRSADAISIATDYGGSTNNNNSIVDGVTIRDNYFGFIDNRFVMLGSFFNPISTVRNILVERNFFETNGLNIPGDQSNGEAIYVGCINQNNIIRNNYMRNISAVGYRESAIEVMAQSAASSNLLIENNTITDVAGVGIRVDVCQVPTASYTVRVLQNVIFNTTESGVTINQPHVELSRNSIYNNGSGGGGRIPIDLVPRHSTSTSTFSLDAGGNGVSANDGALNFTAGNQATDYPMIYAAVECSSSPDIQVNGYVGSSPNQTAFANAIVEIYKASNDGNNMGEVVAGDGRSVIHAEPRTYLGSCTADANGAFSCSLTIPSYVSINSGDMLVGTATVNGSTSETGSVLVLLHDGGDAPSTYSTDIACGAINGPIHMNLSNNLRLGSTVDNDVTMTGSTIANNDDVTGGDDEDGVPVFGNYDQSGTYTVNVQVTNTSGTTAYLVGYIDYNADGDFADAGERSVTRVVTNGSSGLRTVTFNFISSPVYRDTYARFRLSTARIQAESYTGAAVDGEVEDYFMPMSLLPVRLGPLKGVKRGNFDHLSWTTFSEDQTLFFEIEQSKDGLIWQKVATVSALGLSTGAQYEYNHLGGTGSTQHYRVVLHDANGNQKYSNTIKIGSNRIAGSEQFRVDFNQMAREFKVLLPSDQDVYQIRLFTSIGQQVQFGIANRTSEYSIRDKQLTRGLYLVVICDNSNRPVFTQKVMVR